MLNDWLSPTRLGHIARTFPQLTPSEIEVASLVVSGLKTWQIAELLGVNEHNVENVRSRIRSKLDIERTASLRSFLLRHF